MRRFNGQLTTVSTDKLSAFNTDEYLRAVEWVNRPEDVKLRYPENDNALLEFMRTIPLKKNIVKSPLVHWTVDGALATYTKTVGAVLATGTTDVDIVVEDSYIADVGWTVTAPITGEVMLITAVNNATSTWTVTRARFGGTQAALIDGEELRPSAPVVGERGRAKDTHTTEPGDPAHNYISMTMGKTSITTMQYNAAMNGEWGTWDFLMAGAQYQIETAVQSSMIFQHRWTEASTAGDFSSADEGQVYLGAGLMDQLNNNVMHLGDAGNSFLYENASEFMDPMFASDLSANRKVVYCGPSIFANMATTTKQRPEDMSIDIKTGAKEFEIMTNGGNTVVFRRVNGMDGRLSQLGIVLDENNIGASEFEGLGPQWFLDMEDNDSPLERIAAYFMSWGIQIYDRSTCGLMIGNINPLLK